jgi:NADH-quinone oxidoreductase subunit E
MLSEEERREIEAEVANYEQKKAACIDAMKIVQEHRGWVSDEAIQDLAGFLEMSPDELDSVATFYNLIYRKPVGRHVILVCDSVSCWIMGYDPIREHLSSRLGIGLGETTQDGRFTLLPIVCLGTCDHAPAMMVDDELYGDLDPAKIDEILAKHE